MNPNNPSTRHTLAGVIAILLWSTTIAFSRSLTEQLGTLTAAFWIYTLAGILGLVAAELQARGSIKQMTRLNPYYLWGCGLLFVTYITCLYLAVGIAANRIQVLAVGLINYLWPGLSLVFSIPILKQKARPWLPVGLVLALAGVWFATTGTSETASLSVASLITEGGLLPYSLALVAAVCWALYSNFSRQWGSEDGSGAVPLFLLASGLLLGGMRLFTHESTLWTAGSFLQLVYMVVFPAMLAYVLWDIAVRKGNIVLMASLSYLTPLLSTLISSLVLNVIPEPTLWIGTFLVFAGAVISKLSFDPIR